MQTIQEIRATPESQLLSIAKVHTTESARNMKESFEADAKVYADEGDAENAADAQARAERWGRVLSILQS